MLPDTLSSLSARNNLAEQERIAGAGMRTQVAELGRRLGDPRPNELGYRLAAERAQPQHATPGGSTQCVDRGWERLIATSGQHEFESCAPPLEREVGQRAQRERVCPVAIVDEQGQRRGAAAGEDALQQASR